MHAHHKPFGVYYPAQRQCGSRGWDSGWLERLGIELQLSLYCTVLLDNLRDSYNKLCLGLALKKLSRLIHLYSQSLFDSEGDIRCKPSDTCSFFIRYGGWMASIRAGVCRSTGPWVISQRDRILCSICCLTPGQEQVMWFTMGHSTTTNTRATFW